MDNRIVPTQNFGHNCSIDYKTLRKSIDFSEHCKALRETGAEVIAKVCTPLGGRFMM